jgi:hypothetical protein
MYPFRDEARIIIIILIIIIITIIIITIIMKQTNSLKLKKTTKTKVADNVIVAVCLHVIRMVKCANKVKRV